MRQWRGAAWTVRVKKAHVGISRRRRPNLNLMASRPLFAGFDMRGLPKKANQLGMVELCRLTNLFSFNHLTYEASNPKRLPTTVGGLRQKKN